MGASVRCPVGAQDAGQRPLIQERIYVLRFQRRPPCERGGVPRVAQGTIYVA